MGGVDATCPDPKVYDRIERLERAAARDNLRWEQQDKHNDDISSLIVKVERLTTTIRVSTGLMAFLITAGLAALALILSK
jgi:hypothetical protein